MFFPVQTDQQCLPYMGAVFINMACVRLVNGAFRHTPRTFKIKRTPEKRHLYYMSRAVLLGEPSMFIVQQGIIKKEERLTLQYEGHNFRMNY